MKKTGFIFLVITVLFSMVFLTKCSKQNELSTGEQQVSPEPVAVDFSYTVKNGMLSFPTIEEYGKAIDFLAKDEKNGFKVWDEMTKNFTLQQILKEQGLKDNNFVEDEILARLLNSKGQIEIAGKIYQLSNEDRTVQVYDPALKATETYSFDDDVLFPDEMQKGGCKRYSEFYGIGNTDYYGSAYRKYGIYFTLVAKYNSVRVPVFLRYKYTYMSKSGRGGSVEEWSKLYDLKPSNSGVYKVKLRPYSGTRGLIDFKFCVQFYYAKKQVYSYYFYDYNWVLVNYTYRKCNGRCYDCCIKN